MDKDAAGFERGVLLHFWHEMDMDKLIMIKLRRYENLTIMDSTGLAAEGWSMRSDQGVDGWAVSLYSLKL